MKMKINILQNNHYKHFENFLKNFQIKSKIKIGNKQKKHD